MRRVLEHRLHEGGFDEAVSGLVRNSPWWMISLVVHAIAFLILWNIPYEIRVTTNPKGFRTEAKEKHEEPEEEEVVEVEPDIPDETIVEEPLEVEDEAEHSEVDTDSDFDETAYDDGVADAPFTGPSTGTSIGLGGGAGGGRRGRGGRRNATVRGGSGLTENAVEMGLKWLADHQDVDTDGRWDSDDFMKHDPADDKCDGSGQPLYDVGVSGLALLAFLGAGYADRGTRRENRYARNVRAGLRYLMSAQNEDGSFGTRQTEKFMYNHAIATLAMCEAYWMTRNPRYKKPAQEGLNYLAMARNPYMAWRYEPRGGENDLSITGWCVMALKSGKFAGLEVDPDAFEGARHWTENMTDPKFGGAGYTDMGGGTARP